MQSARMSIAQLDLKTFLKSPNLLSNSVRFFLVVAFPIVAYSQDFIQIFYLALADPEIQYVLLVPFFAAFFFYKLRKAFSISRKNSFFHDVIGIPLCCLALLIYVFGSYSLYPLQIHLLSLSVFVAGITLLAFGVDVLRILIFPIFLLAFLSPFPLILLDSFGGLLIESVATSIAFILRVFLPVELSYTPIVVLSTYTSIGERISFQLGAPCSGIYSLTSFAFFGVIFAYIATGSPIKKTFFAGLSLLTAYVLNVFRVLTMVVLGRFFGYGLAIEFFHLFGGIALIFFGTLILLYFGDKIFKLSLLQRRPRYDCPVCKEYKSICYGCGRILKLPKVELKWKRLTLIFLFIVLLTTLIFQASAVNYNKVLLDENMAIDFNPDMGEVMTLSNLNGWSTKFLGRESQAEEILGLSFIGDYTLYKDDGSSTVVAIFEISDLQSKFHTWEGCLHYQSFEINIEKRFFSTLYDENNILVIGETFIANAPTLKQTIIILYWFEALNLKINETIGIWNIKVSLLKYVYKPENQTNIDQVEAGTAELLSLGKDIESSWSQYKNPPTSFVVDLYKNKEALATVITGMLIVSVAISQIKYLAEKTKIRRKIAELPKRDQIFLQELKHASSAPFKRDENGSKAYPLKKIEKLKQQGILREKVFLENGELYVKFVS